MGSLSFSFSSFNFLSLNKIAIFKLKQNEKKNYYFYYFYYVFKLSVPPTLKSHGSPTPQIHTYIKIYLSNFEYNLLNKHVEYSDQHMAAVHPSLCNKDFKFITICTIILISLMTLALKVCLLAYTLPLINRQNGLD